MNDSSPHHNGSGEIREIPSLAAAAARSGDGETVLLAIQGLVRQLGCLVFDSKQGIPTDLFYFVSRMTPLVNVDLLIRDEGGRTLLIWRDDEFYHGWHIAGGIIRFKERAADRIAAVAALELARRSRQTRSLSPFWRKSAASGMCGGISSPCSTAAGSFLRLMSNGAAQISMLRSMASGPGMPIARRI